MVEQGEAAPERGVERPAGARGAPAHRVLRAFLLKLSSEEFYGEVRLTFKKGRVHWPITVKQFRGRKAEHFVFPSQRVGFSGNDEIPQVFDTNPARAISSWKVAWTTAREVAEVKCRFHDLRHTCITRLLERGVPLSVVGSLMGWSAATTARMAKRYAHFGQSVHRQAMDSLDPPPPPTPSDDEDAKDGRRDVH